VTRKITVKYALLCCLFFLGLGGWLLHLRIHPPSGSAHNYIPFITGIISVFFLSGLFAFRKTLALGYILNGFFVILGTITMAHFSIAHFKGPVTFSGIFLNTTLADISMLWGKFAAGKALFGLEFLKTDADPAPRGRFFRYPNMGWWWVHLAAISAIYTAGNILWK